MKPLFEIQAQYFHLANLLTENGGEITPEIETGLAIAESDLQVKASNYAAIISKLEAESTSIDERIKALQGWKKATDNAVERLKSAIKGAMEQFGIEEIKSDYFKINFRKSTSVEIVDESLIPAFYKEAKTTYTISKKELKEDLEHGNEIPGAVLHRNKNLQIK